MARFNGFEIEYANPDVFYMEYKDIFRHRIYDFETKSDRPLVIDCGSHAGMSVLRVKSTHPGSRVVAFEPDPDISAMLQRNIQKNHLSNVAVHTAALSTVEGSRSFVQDLDAGHLGTTPAGSIDVRAIRLGAFLNDPVSLLKMNIEGAELEVLADVVPQLGSVEQMIIEYHGFEDRSQYLHDLLALLDDASFKYLVHDFDSETNAATKPPFSIRPDTRFFLLIYAKRKA